jgi:hypothetical protein
MSKEIVILVDGYQIKSTINFRNICLTIFGKEIAMLNFVEVFNNTLINEKTYILFSAVDNSGYLIRAVKKRL